MKIHCLRLQPEQDLKKSIAALVQQKKVKAGAIVTCVGSLNEVCLRMAGQKENTLFSGKHEIVSLVGTLGIDGVHLHLGVSDSTGKMTGGHLMNGNLVNTTAEIVIAELEGYEFKREHDAQTGYDELVIRES